MKKMAKNLLKIWMTLESWLRGTERIVVQPGQARGRLGSTAMGNEIWTLMRFWQWSDWGISSCLFFLLMWVAYVPWAGGYLWLIAAPVISAAMLQFILNHRWKEQRELFGWLRWSVRCVVLNYTILAWFFFYLVCGAAVALLLAGLLDFVLIRIPYKRAWSFSFLHLAWILPLLFFLGVIARSLRFYLGAYLALPLVVLRDGGVWRSIQASRTACRKRLVMVTFWMFLGWLISFLPGLVFLTGSGLWIATMVDRLPGTFSSLWKIYAGSSLLMAGCLVLALLAWPFGFLVQAAAYRRVFIRAQTDAEMPNPTTSRSV
jgi:hypothetical protein